MSPTEITQLTTLLRKRFHTDSLEVKAVPNHPAAGVYDGEDFLGLLTRDEDEGEISYDFVMRLDGGDTDKMTAWEMARLEQVLSEKMNDPQIKVKTREKKLDSGEVYSGEEFLGIVFCSEEADDNEVSFNMGILDIDLEEAAGSA